MIGKVLWDEFFTNRDWPVASAVAVAMLVLPDPADGFSAPLSGRRGGVTVDPGPMAL